MKRLHAFAAIGVLSLFLVPALSVFAADINIGLHVKDSTGIVNIAGSTDLNASKLHIETATGIKSVLYVTPADPAASKAMIRLGSGATMALKKFIGAPATPTGLATTSALCGGNVNLTWNASANAKNYKVYRNGVLATTTTNTTFADTGLTVSTSYTYTVAASNDSGDSAVATLVTGSSGSCIAVAPVITVTTDTTCGGRIIISWSAVPTATSYKIFRNGTLIATTTSLVYTDTGLTVSTSYTYTVVTTNASGDSPASTAQSATSSQSCAPTAPTLSVSTDTSCGGRIAVTWGAVPNATSYKLYRNGVLIASPSSPNLIDVTPLTSTSYTYTAVSSNASGDSATSTAVSAVSSQVCAPASFGIQSVGSCGTGQVTLSWVPQNDAQAYKITRTNNVTSTTVVATTTGSTASTYTDSGLTANTSYTYYAVSSNGRGGYATSTPAITNSPNVCAPTTAPATFTATTGACSTNNVVLAWSAVTGATAYRVYTDYGSGFYTQIATTTSLTYTFTGGNYITPYSYEVLGYNGGGDSPLFATASAPGPMMCLTSMNFWAVPASYIGYPYGTFENHVALDWSSTGASSCTGNGNGLNLFGTWGTGGAGDPTHTTSGSKDSANLTPTGVAGTPLTTSTMFSMACMNGNGVFGDNISLVATPTSYAIPISLLTFVPTRDASGNPVVNYTTGKVQGWIKYGCNYSSPLNAFSVSSDGGSTWSAVTTGAGVATYNTSTGALTGQYSTGQSNTLGYFGGKQYKLDCHASVTSLGVTTDYGDAVIYIAPRADTASDNWQSLAWFPWMGGGNATPPPVGASIWRDYTANPPAGQANIKYQCTNYGGTGVVYIDGSATGNTTSGSTVGSTNITTYQITHAWQLHCGSVVSGVLNI